MKTKLVDAPATVELPPLDYTRLIAEDQKDKESNELFRFGYVHVVNYDLSNSGTWSTLDNGDRIWRLRTVSYTHLTLPTTPYV